MVVFLPGAERPQRYRYSFNPGATKGRKMRIAVLGSGNIGGNLGKLFAKAGHDVFFASRNPECLAPLVTDAGPSAIAGTVEEALMVADTIVDALPYAATLQLPAEELSDKILISASNYYPDRDGEINLEGLSQTEAVAKRLPDTQVVKAFNMLYFKELEARLLGGGTRGASMLMAGDDADAKILVAELIRDAKFDPVDVGKLAVGRLFQTDGPLYGHTLRVEEVRARMAALRSSVT